jgi:hypothetical protein
VPAAISKIAAFTLSGAMLANSAAADALEVAT